MRLKKTTQNTKPNYKSQIPVNHSRGKTKLYFSLENLI